MLQSNEPAHVEISCFCPGKNERVVLKSGVISLMKEMHSVVGVLTL